MYRWFLTLPVLLVLALDGAAAARADDALEEADRQAIRSVIEAQSPALGAASIHASKSKISSRVSVFNNPAGMGDTSETCCVAMSDFAIRRR